MTAPNNHEEEHPMNTKSIPSAQAQTQDVVPGVWQPISSAPIGDTTACIDVWCGEYDHRVTDCFWNRDVGGWCYDFFNDAADEYRVTQVKNPTHWMPSPTRPE